MIEESLKKIEAVLQAVDRSYQSTTLEGDFEKRGLETQLPDIKGALAAVKNIRCEIKKSCASQTK